MGIINELERLMADAKNNVNLRNSLIAASRQDDPMKKFCDICLSNGYEIYLGELFAYGQDMSDSKLRSVNGGGVNAIEGWDDTFILIVTQLENMAE